MKLNVLIFVIFFCPNYPSNDAVIADTCPAEIAHTINSSFIDVLWDAKNAVSPEYSEVIEASPLCLDEFKKNILRRCEDSKWIPDQSPNCHSYQIAFDKTELCPFNYQSITVEGKILCILISEPKSWQNVCLYSGITTLFYDLNEFEKREVLAFLKVRNISEVWMPARSLWNYGPITWTVANEMFGETIEFDKLELDLIDENNIVMNGCLSAIVDSDLMTGSIQNCNNNKRLICIFRRNDDFLQPQACQHNYLTIPYYNTANECYSIQSVSIKAETVFDGDDESFLRKIKSKCKGDLFTMNSIEKTVIFMALANHIDLDSSNHCLFSIAPENIFIKDENHWKSMVNNIDYVNWDYPIINGMVLTTNHNGKWNWINKTIDCLACQYPIDIYSPELILTFNKRKRLLLLTIYDEEYLWRKWNEKRDLYPGFKCFTNAGDELIRTVEIRKRIWYGKFKIHHLNSTKWKRRREKSKAIYELKLYGDGPGYYWCNGHTINKFNSVESSKVVAFKRDKYEVFAILLNITCDQCQKLFNEYHAKILTRQYKEFLKNIYKNFRKTDDYVNKFSFTEINVENIRIMQIDYISEPLANGTHFATILFHASVTFDHFDDRKLNPNYTPKLSSDRLRIYVIKEILIEMLKTTMTHPTYKFISLNSTEFCLPESQNSSNGLSWISANIGETIPSNELCLLANGLPVLRMCTGDFLYGGLWQNITKQQCYRKPPKLTKKLFELHRDGDVFALNNEFKNDTIKELSTLFQDNTNDKNIVAADLFYLGRLMNDLVRLNNNNSIIILEPSDTEYIFSIYNNLMYLNESTTRKSAILNSTNILLDAFDNIINSIPMDSTFQMKYCNNVIVNLDDGIIATQTPNLIVYVIDPFIKNISGLALIKKSQLLDETDDFTDYNTKMLYANQSLTELLHVNGLEIATFVPIDLLNNLKDSNRTSDNTTSLKIVITVYNNDRLFQEFKIVTQAKPLSKIISVSIPGYDTFLPSYLPIFMKIHDNSTDSMSVCGYWNFELDDFATWSHDGCDFGGISLNSNDSTILCLCSHLTHYSYLIVGTYAHPMNPEEDDVIITASIHQKALDIITLLGCSLSLMGIGGITITAVVFRSWREKPSSIVLLQLSAAIALQMILLCFVNTEYSSMHLIAERKLIACVALGALLQYSILVAFSWMLISAYLQFMRYVKVLGPSRSTRFFLKSFLFGWTMPLIPVLIVVLIAPQSYVQSVDALNNDGICYPSGGSLYFGLILPIGLIIVANLIIFIMVIYNILFGSSVHIRSNKRILMIAQLRLSIFLFFLLGLSWIFGFLASIKSGIIFSYLFCITATIQGFVLFIYFIILDPNTRKLWHNSFDHFTFCPKKN